VIRRFPRRSLLFISCLFFHLLSMESLEFQSKP
jgi:hypothetical protein